MTLLETRLGIDYDRWRSLHPSTRRIVLRACLQKRPYTPEDALTACVRMRHRGEAVRKYRCPFCGDHHVGHVPDMKTIAAIALAIRDLHGDRPTKRKIAVS